MLACVGITTSQGDTTLLISSALATNEMRFGCKICSLDASEGNAYAVSLCSELEPTPRPISHSLTVVPMTSA